MANADEYAAQVIRAGRDLGVSPRGIVIALATVFVESNWTMYANESDPESLSFPHEALSYDANSVGLFQQRAEWWGTCADRMDPYRSAVMFFNSLKRYDYNDTSRSPGSWAQRVQGSAFPDRYDTRMGEAQALYDRLTSSPKEASVEAVIKYSRSAIGAYDGVAQQRSWDCGPASAQIILQAAGVLRDEQYLIDRIGTTVNGTNHSGLITPVLNDLLPGSGYTTVWLTKEPVPRTQVEALWKNVKKSIDGSRGAIFNFVAPPGNFPRATRGGVSPEYRGTNTIYHYVACMGYADDGPGGRHFWIADPGFRPFGYWCSLEQVATLIVPHSYAYASTAAAAPAPPPAPPAPRPALPVDRPNVSFTDTLEELLTEWNAIEYGDMGAIESIVKAAQAGDDHGTAALALLERQNPAALQAFINSRKG